MGFQTYIYLNKSTLTSYLRIVYCICCTEDAPFYTRDLRISRRVVPFDKLYGRGQGVEGDGRRGGGIGLSTDRIINEIRRAGLETSLTLSQCNMMMR